MLNPEATFDCLSVGIKLQNNLGDFAEAEVHIFSYLACLLTLYESQNEISWNKPLSDWGYKFTSTKGGFLYSFEINQAFIILNRNGLILKAENGNYQITELGNYEFNQLINLSRNSKRELFLEGACSSVLALPVGTIRNAIYHDPELGKAKAISSARTLLDGPGLNIIYEQFEALSKAIGLEVGGLMTPSVTWLTYLNRVSEKANLIS